MSAARVERLAEPRYGVAGATAVLSLVMAAHWPVMAAPAVVALALVLWWPHAIVRPITWWGMAGVWTIALVLTPGRFEDHVYLYTAWLVALAISLSVDEVDTFLDRIGWQARILIGATFSAAVAWKLYFGEFVSGIALWFFMTVDHRFGPLASAVGLDPVEAEQDRSALSDLLEGAAVEVLPEPSSGVMLRIAAVAVAALALEALIAVSHFAPDATRLAKLRVPSIVLFALLTYTVVPVLLFAATLAVMTMAAARWRREVLWVFPVMVLPSLLRALLV